MDDDKTYGIFQGEEQGGAADSKMVCSCGITEEEFPCMGKCVKIHDISGVKYLKRCMHCSIWTSLPDGASLEVVHIFDCNLYGYGKRIRNGP